VNFRVDEAGTEFVCLSYSVKNKLKPVKKGRVRVDLLHCFVVKAVEGSDGKQSEAWRMDQVRRVTRKVCGRRPLTPPRTDQPEVQAGPGDP
jgi:hypothetical protein